MQMSNRLVLVAMVASTTLAGSAALAADTPKAAPENDVIKASVGNWKCEGTEKGPDGQEAKFKSTWSIKPALGGHWFALIYKRDKSFEGNATVGFDAVTKKYVFSGYDNMGGWIDLSSSDGATFTGDGSVGGKKGPVKFAFTPGKDKKGEESPKLFDLAMDFGVASSTESCKK